MTPTLRISGNLPFVSERELRELLASAGLLNPVLEDALQFTRILHGPRLRIGGGPDLEEHLYPVTKEVTLYTVSSDTSLRHLLACTALLHDCVEDCKVELDVLERRFGTAVARLVDLLSDCWQPGGRWKPLDSYWSGIYSDPGAAVVRIIDRHLNLLCAHKMDASQRLAGFLDDTASRVIPLAERYMPERAPVLRSLVENLRALKISA